MKRIALLSLLFISAAAYCQTSAICDEVTKSKFVDTVNHAVRYSTDLINVEKNGLKQVPFTFLEFVARTETKYSLYLSIKDSLRAKPKEKGVVIVFEGGFQIAINERELLVGQDPFKHAVEIELNAMQINIFRTKRIASFSLASHVQGKIDAVWAEKTRQGFVCMTGLK